MEEAVEGLGDRWEAGSGFVWSQESLEPRARATLPTPRALFATARGALEAIAPSLSPPGGRPRLHLPSYFHAEVAEGLRAAYDVAWYHDLPTRAAPDFSTLRAQAGDAVLVVDYFGVRDPATWRGRLPRGVALIEDRTHDPFGPGAGEGPADYAVASLRKTLPLPDGALLWSPRGRALPQPTSPPSPAAASRLMAMVLKKAYLDGAPVAKEAYRALETRAEQELGLSGMAAASAFTSAVLPGLPVQRWRAQRTANVRHLLTLASEVRGAPWQPLFVAWPRDAAPFNAVLLCDAPATRDRLERALVAERIYPAVHWRFPAAGSPSRDAAAEGLAGRVLTLPCDQRYGAKDLERVALALHAFARGGGG